MLLPVNDKKLTSFFSLFFWGGAHQMLASKCVLKSKIESINYAQLVLFVLRGLGIRAPSFLALHFIEVFFLFFFGRGRGDQMLAGFPLSVKPRKVREFCHKYGNLKRTVKNCTKKDVSPYNVASDYFF